MIITRKVTLAFDPERSTDELIRLVFRDPVARTLWLSIRPTPIHEMETNL